MPGRRPRYMSTPDAHRESVVLWNYTLSLDGHERLRCVSSVTSVPSTQSSVDSGVLWRAGGIRYSRGQLKVFVGDWVKLIARCPAACRVLVGAPRDNVSHGWWVDAERPGAVYSCPLSSLHDDCSQLAIDYEGINQQRVRPRPPTRYGATGIVFCKWLWGGDQGGR